MQSYPALLSLLQELEIPEDEAMKALLSAFTPANPGVISSTWKLRVGYGVAPDGRALWDLYKKAGFKCTKCNSKHRVTIDHIDRNPKNVELSNLQVLCMDCNRASNSRGTKNNDIGVRIFKAFVSYKKEHGKNPTNAQIREITGIADFSSGYYLINYLRGLNGEDVELREYKKKANQSLETTTMAVTPAASHPSRQP